MRHQLFSVEMNFGRITEKLDQQYYLSVGKVTFPITYISRKTSLQLTEHNMGIDYIIYVNK